MTTMDRTVWGRVHEVLGWRCPLPVRMRVVQHLQASVELCEALEAAYELGGSAALRTLVMGNLTTDLYAAVVEASS